MKKFKDYIKDSFLLDYIFEELNILKPLNEKVVIKKPKKLIQPFPKYTKGEDLKSYYNNVVKEVKPLKSKLEKILKFATRKTGHSKILVDIKSFPSYQNKVVMRGKNPQKITDILRSAILVDNNSDIAEIIKQLKHKVKIVEYEIKDFGEDKVFGYYGSHHLLLKIDDVYVELQIMTKNAWKTKDTVLHDLYGKLRGKSPEEIKKYEKDIRMAKNLHKKYVGFNY